MPDSPTFNVIFSAATLVSIKLTLTLMVLLSAGAYRSSPANETVIVALPFLILLILPFSTITTSVLFEV